MSWKDKIKSKGLKITWLAEQIGIQQPLLSMYINGDREMPEEVKKKLKELLN